MDHPVQCLSVLEPKSASPVRFTVRGRGWRYTALPCFWEGCPEADLASQPLELCRDGTRHCPISVHSRSPAASIHQVRSVCVSLESQTGILSWWVTNKILVSCYSLALNKRIKAFSISVAMCQLPGAFYCAVRIASGRAAAATQYLMRHLQHT